MATKSAAAQPKSKQPPIDVVKLAPHLGAEIRNIDLSQPMSEAIFAEINDALVAHEVLVFRNQSISREAYVSFARGLGPLTVHPFATSLPDLPEMIVLDNDKDSPPLSTDQWHSDEMFRAEPPAATLLRSQIVPEFGGDTLIASMTAAYDGLNPSLQAFYETLEAVHDFKVFRELYSASGKDRQRVLEMEELFPNMIHPVVRKHPVSGRHVVYVSPQTTKRIKDVRDFESDAILAMLYQLPETPEYQLRIRWEPDMIVIWDNRSTQHYAPRDYLPARRKMERLTIKGDAVIAARPLKKSKSQSRNLRGTGRAARTGHHKKTLARPSIDLLKAKR